MKQISKFFLSILLCCSQTFICMEKIDNSEKMTIQDYHVMNSQYKGHRLLDFHCGKERLPKTYEKNQNKIISLEKQLEEKRLKTLVEMAPHTKSDNLSNKQHIYIDYYGSCYEPDYFSHILQTMLQQNNPEPKKIMPTYGKSDHIIRVLLSWEFIEALSLEEQETFCNYLIYMIQNSHFVTVKENQFLTEGNFLTEKDCIDESSLFITFALQNTDRAVRCYKLLERILFHNLSPKPSYELYRKMYHFYKDYEYIEWLKKYAISGNQQSHQYYTSPF